MPSAHDIAPPRRLRFGRPAETPPDQLIHGDNREVLEGLADRSMDLVYIDPPFGTGAARLGKDGSSYADPGGDPEALVRWLSPCLEHTRRTLTLHGSLFVHLDHRAVHYVKVALDRLFGRDRMVNEIIWCYSVGGKSRRSFGRKHDTILWYSRTKDYVFRDNDKAVRIARKSKSHMRAVTGDDGLLYQEKTDRKSGVVYRYPVDLGKVPEDWWTDIETLNRSDRERTGWPTQKPARLLERILLAASEEGATVADWFSGSATTAVVAQRNGRRFLAVDREATAIAIAARRLEQSGHALAQAGSPPPDVDVVSLASAAPAPDECSRQLDLLGHLPSMEGASS